MRRFNTCCCGARSFGLVMGLVCAAASSPSLAVAGGPDFCAGAAEALEGADAGNNAGFTNEVVVSCSPSGADAWFVHTALCTGEVEFNTTGTAFDTILAIFDECGGAELACDDDSGPGADSVITLAVVAGEDYYIRVAGFNNATGDIVLNIFRTDTCRVDGVCFAAGAPNVANQCEVCAPESTPDAWSPRPKGTACGNPVSTNPQCDSADSCDGLGACDPNNKPAGTVCGNPAATDCDAADSCDGLGLCDDNIRPPGFACGSPADTDCDDPDTCDGGGGCLTNLESAGTLCGSPADTNCDNPDTCNGVGLCLQNIEPDGTACPNGLFCDGAELCTAGQCEDQADPCAGFVDCDEANDICLECFDVNDCGDVDPENGVSDNNCIWYQCAGNQCNEVPRIFGDAGGPFGDCPPDGFTNIFDRNHVLTCFEMTNPCDSLNIDIGGPFGDCNPDGFCNLQDVNHALTAFAGTNNCTCPSNPSPAAAPQVVGHADLVLAAEQGSAAPGEKIAVRVMIAEPLDGLQSYQLETVVSGGRRGHLELIAVSIEDRADHVFAGHSDTFGAFNPATAQMLSGLTGGGVMTAPKSYLATFTYRASRDAAGTFTVDIARDRADQSALVSSFVDLIEIDDTRPAVITIESASRRK